MWRVAGTYFESCNCDAICPCRRTDGAEGGKSTHGVCDFALSWWVQHGHYDDEKLDGLAVVMAGSYEDRPRWKPWEVALLVDERASTRAQSALAEIFLGKAGGTPMANYTMAIGEVRSIRPATIRLDHRRGHERTTSRPRSRWKLAIRPRRTARCPVASRATTIPAPSCMRSCCRCRNQV
jgi:hypothetical protein